MTLYTTELPGQGWGHIFLNSVAFIGHPHNPGVLTFLRGRRLRSTRAYVCYWLCGWAAKFTISHGAGAAPYIDQITCEDRAHSQQKWTTSGNAKENQKSNKKPKQIHIYTHISHAVPLEMLSQGSNQKVFKCTYTEKLTLERQTEDPLP